MISRYISYDDIYLFCRKKKHFLQTTFLSSWTLTDPLAHYLLSNLKAYTLNSHILDATGCLYTLQPISTSFVLIITRNATFVFPVPTSSPFICVFIYLFPVLLSMRQTRKESLLCYIKTVPHVFLIFINHNLTVENCYISNILKFQSLYQYLYSPKFSRCRNFIVNTL